MQRVRVSGDGEIPPPSTEVLDRGPKALADSHSHPPPVWRTYLLKNFNSLYRSINVCEAQCEA